MLAGRFSVFAVIVGLSALPALATEGPARQQADNAAASTVPAGTEPAGTEPAGTEPMGTEPMETVPAVTETTEAA